MNKDYSEIGMDKMSDRELREVEAFYIAIIAMSAFSVGLSLSGIAMSFLAIGIFVFTKLVSH